MNTGDGRSYNAEFSWFEVEPKDRSSISPGFAYKHSWIESTHNPAQSAPAQLDSDPNADLQSSRSSQLELSSDHAATMSLYPLGSSSDDDNSQNSYSHLEAKSTDGKFTYFEEDDFGSDTSSQQPPIDALSTSSMDSSQLHESENEPSTEGCASDYGSKLSTQDVWNRLSRVAALGLKSGEALKPCPVLVQQDTPSSTETTTAKDIQVPSRPIDTYNEVQGLLEGLDDLKPNTDIGSRIGSSNSDVPLHDETSEELENHPFFTTMELKNKVFEQTGQFGEQFEKSATKLEKQGWDPKSDDLIVTSKRRWGLRKH